MQEAADTMPDDGHPLAKALEAQAQALQNVAVAVVQSAQATQQGIAQLVQAEMAEHEIVRGPDGRVSGSRKRWN